MDDQNPRMKSAWSACLLVAGLTSCAWAYPSVKLASVFPMEVVEPLHTPSSVAAAPEPSVKKEDFQVLKERMAMQRALRNMRAKRLLEQRRSGTQAWLQGMQKFLEAQRLIQTQPGRRKEARPPIRIPSPGKEAPNPSPPPARDLGDPLLA